MSTENQAAAGGAAPAATTESASLLEQAISATKQTERSRAEDLIRTLTEEALKGTVTYDKNITVTINKAIKALDSAVSKQLNAVMHHQDFLKLEGSWRGLHHLVMNSETSTNLKLKVFNVSKRELFKDVDKAVEFDQSQIFKKLYENEFGTPGGEPYGSLIGDYEFTNHPEDLELLSKMSNGGRRASVRHRGHPKPSYGVESRDPPRCLTVPSTPGVAPTRRLGSSIPRAK